MGINVENNRGLVVAYIVGRYPALSESFIRNEARELIKIGVKLRILSLRSALETDRNLAGLTSEEKVYCLEGNYRKGLHRVMMHSGLLIKDTSRYLRTLIWVLRNDGSWRLFKAAPYLVDKVKGADWIHGTFAWDQAGMAAILSRLTGIPFSFAARAADIFVSQRRLPMKLREASFVVTISEYNRRYLRGVCPDTAEKIHIIHSSHSPERFNYERKVPEDHLKILSVGRLIEKKGYSCLLQALGILKGNLGRPFQCRIIGSGPLEGPLCEEIMRLGISEQAELAGPAAPEDVLAEIASSHMVVQPCVRSANGDQDGIPNVLMEAMWLGVPVISTRLSGIPELVQHERTGILVQPGNHQDLAQAIQRLDTEPELCQKLAQAGKEKVMREFNIHIEVKKLADLIRKRIP